MVKVLLNCAFTLVAIAVYDHFKIDEVGAPIAVANYDAALTAAGVGADNDQISGAMEALRKDATKLAAAGFIVIDSRTLLGYPAGSEIPVVAPVSNEAGVEPASNEDVEKGTLITGDSFDGK